MVDAVQPLDNFSLRRREEVAMRLAVATGDIDRARQAAERLFGLRLETETQITLSGQMHQLGLHELAEAVLGRARRRAGNKATALVGLMLQYQRQQKLDQAVQVAMQILRSTTASRQSASASLLAEDPEAARTAAITVLARSGRLTQLIDRANEQLAKTPNAVQVHQALADYYTAARQPAKARAELARIVELRPEDVDMRLRVAGQLVQDGQADAAIEQYRATFKKDPSQLGRIGLGLLQSAFRQAGKPAELLRLFEESDLRSTLAPRGFERIIVDVPDDTAGNERVVSLFRKLWAAFPEGHTQLLAYTGRDAVWQMSEIYDYAREAIIPRPPVPDSYLYWYPFRTAEFHANVTRRPAGPRPRDCSTWRRVGTNWINWPARSRRPARGSPTGPPAMSSWRWPVVAPDGTRTSSGSSRGAREPQEGPDRLIYHIRMVRRLGLGLELEGRDQTRDLALTVYADSMDNPYAFLQFRLATDKVPHRRLERIYISKGQYEEARRALLEVAPRQKVPDSYSELTFKLYRARHLTGRPHPGPNSDTAAMPYRCTAKRSS